jgi:hypothetical protein
MRSIGRSVLLNIVHGRQEGGQRKVTLHLCAYIKKRNEANMKKVIYRQTQTHAKIAYIQNKSMGGGAIDVPLRFVHVAYEKGERKESIHFFKRKIRFT